jgi:hypothetical protein
MPGGAVGQQPPDSAFTSRYNALVQRQAELLYSDDALSTLRVQYTYAQLWYLYNDSRFTYWSYELNNIVPQLQTRPDLMSTAQDIASWLTQYSQQIFASSGATVWFNDWAQRWTETVRNVAGYTDLEQATAQLLADFPAFAQYLSLNQEMATKAATLFADPTVAQTATQYAQAFANAVQELLRQTSYEAVVEQFRTQLQALLTADPTYQMLQGETQRITPALTNLQQMIHDTVAYCAQFGYGDSCFDPSFNTSLQTVLPQYNSDNNQVLMDAAELTETSNQFGHEFSQSAAFHSLQQAYLDTVQTTVAAVLPNLQQAQDDYTQNVINIPAVYAQVGELWSRMVELVQELGGAS